MDIAKYKQMIGRAGRAGHAAAGDSYLLCKREESEAVETMLRGAMPPSDSVMLECARMKKLLLTGIGSGDVRTCEQLEAFLNHTLLAHGTAEYNDIHACAKDALKGLVDNGVIEWLPDKAEFAPTTLGLATACCGTIEPCEARSAHALLSHAIKGGVTLTSQLHLLFLVIPPNWASDRNLADPRSACVPDIDWISFFQRFCALDEVSLTTAQLCGIEEHRLAAAAQQRRLPKAVDPEPFVRFFLALILRDMIAQRRPVEALAAEAQLSVARLEHLRNGCCTKASSLSQMCSVLAENSRREDGGGGGGWTHMESLLGRLMLEIQPMDQAIAESQLLEVEGIADWQARVLFAAGITSPKQLASALPKRVAELLRRRAKGGSQVAQAERLVKKAKVLAARQKREELLEAAEVLKEEMPGEDASPLRRLIDTLEQ